MWPLRFLLLDNYALNAPEGLLVSDPIKVAVLGFWHVHAAEYAARAQQPPDTELVAAWDADAARGRAGADAVGASFVADLDDLLDRDDIDAVTVTTATTAHHALMLRVVQAGKHIFTEKLLAPTVAEAEEIIAAADQAGIALVVSLPRLYHGYTRAIADQLGEERLGNLTYSRIRLSHDGAIAGWLPDRFYDPQAGCPSGYGERHVRLVHPTPGRRPGRCHAWILGWRDRGRRNRLPEQRPVQH